jgi:hypothetical protein
VGDPDAWVVDEHEDAGLGVGSAEADVVEAAGVAATNDELDDGVAPIVTKARKEREREPVLVGTRRETASSRPWRMRPGLDTETAPSLRRTPLCSLKYPLPNWLTGLWVSVVRVRHVWWAELARIRTARRSNEGRRSRRTPSGTVADVHGRAV